MVGAEGTEGADVETGAVAARVGATGGATEGAEEDAATVPARSQGFGGATIVSDEEKPAEDTGGMMERGLNVLRGGPGAPP